LGQVFLRPSERRTNRGQFQDGKTVHADEPKGRRAIIEIAGGIVLAVLFLARLPAIIQGALWLAAVGLVLVVVIGAGWLLLAGAQSAEGLGAGVIVAGGFFV